MGGSVLSAEEMVTTPKQAHRQRGPLTPGVGAVSSLKPSAALVQNEPDALIEGLLEIQQNSRRKRR
jgi:hypothetical protein